MTCDETLEALLEADPHELAPGSPTPLGRHLASCGRCRRAAELVRSGTDALDRWLDAPPPPLDVETFVAALTGPDRPAEGAPAAGAPGPGGDAAATAGATPVESPPDARPRRRSGRLRRTARYGLPLALAAAAATVLLLERPADPLPGTPWIPPAAGAEADLDLDVPPGRDAAVLHTTDPDITVVWFFNGD